MNRGVVKLEMDQFTNGNHKGNGFQINAAATPKSRGKAALNIGFWIIRRSTIYRTSL